MVDAPRTAPSTVRPFPDGVPILVDRAAGVTLRAHDDTDIEAMVEQCRDPEMIRWTTVPVPPSGYGRSEALDFLRTVRAGWLLGDRLSWAVEVERDDRPAYAGGVTIEPAGPVAELGFGLHPAFRGRSVMSAAVRLVRDHAFDALGLDVLRWRAAVGNWDSRRVAAAAGFAYDGTVRRLLDHRGELLDGWVATLTRDDPRTPQPWLDQPVLTGRTVVLRPFTERDADRIVEACSDPRTRYWLISLPQPYGRADASDYVESARELPARGLGLVWCLADPVDDRCLGSLSLEGLGGYARRAEIGYWAHPEARGRGVVTEAVRLVTEHAEAGLVDSIVIRCADGNRASRHVTEAAGYHQSGCLPASEPVGTGDLVDLISYSRP